MPPLPAPGLAKRVSLCFTPPSDDRQVADQLAVYNKWHETELERWLADHGVPHTTAADRKELENLVKEHWQTNVAQPYNNWSPSQLQSYLTSKGDKTKEKAAKSKDSLLSQVMASWTETEEQASSSYGSVKEWIFES